MGSKARKITKFFNEDEYVYRMKLNMTGVANILIETALDQIDERLTENDEVVELLKKDAEFAAQDFIDSIRKRVCQIVKNYPRTSYVHIGSQPMRFWTTTSTATEFSMKMTYASQILNS